MEWHDDCHFPPGEFRMCGSQFGCYLRDERSQQMSCAAFVQNTFAASGRASAKNAVYRHWLAWLMAAVLGFAGAAAWGQDNPKPSKPAAKKGQRSGSGEKTPAGEAQ